MSHRQPGPVARPQHWRRAVRRAGLGLAEIVTAVGVALLFLAWSNTINVDPMVRIGQVAGLAQLQLAFAVAALVLVLGLALAHRLTNRRGRALATRIACAAVAGLSTGVVAGGMVVALRQTPYGLWAGGGDYGWILQWVGDAQAGIALPRYYPPGIIWLIQWWSNLSGLPPVYAVKGIQLILTALFGPAAYLAWRLVLGPGWALAIGVVAMLPLIEPVKPYPQLSLVVLMPVLVALLRRVRHIDALAPLPAALIGLAYGLGLGLLFLLYHGWFVWCAAGVVAAFAIVAPWRRLPRPDRLWQPLLALLGTTIASFLIITWPWLVGLLTETGGANDQYFYFDTDTDPAYFAMWLNDRPGAVGVWPPLGELGHVSLFPLLLVTGVGLALWLGWRRTVVICLGLVAVGAWLIRMWLAGRSYVTLTVALYPRTTAVLLYLTLALTGFAIHLAAGAGWQRLARTGVAPRRVPTAIALIPLLLLFALAGSATVDHYLPGPRGSPGEFALVAQLRRQLDGQCPIYGAGRGCGNGPPYSQLEPVPEHTASPPVPPQGR
ncbi:MAG TPA: hypothetical protein VF163_09445 [Micromonosporaceae bacterium]